MVELNTTDIVKRINDLFDNDNQFVFWYDAAGDFKDNFPLIAEQIDAESIDMKADEQFKTKLHLVDLEKAGQKALIYSAAAKPDLKNNFLADIIRYSKEYTADATVLLLEELGLPSNQKAFVTSYSKFFANKERINRFKTILNNSQDVMNYETVILAALAKITSTSSVQLLKSVLMAGLEDNVLLAEFEKYEVVDTFWNMMASQYGYMNPEPRLIELVSGLFTVYTFETMAIDLPDNLTSYKSFNTANATSVVSNFFNMTDMHDVMKRLSNEVWEFINGYSIFAKYDITKLLTIDTFEAIDQEIIKWINQRILEQDFVPSGINLNDLTHKRQNMFFGDIYLLAYKMLRKAITLLSSNMVPSAQSLEEAINNYIGDTQEVTLSDDAQANWQIDTAYRKYSQYRNHLDLHLQELFDDLSIKVEKTYLNNYLTPLTKQWTSVYNVNSVDDKHLQRNFYNTKIMGSTERSVVIISDAFRFEAAKELQKNIKRNESQFSAEIDYMITGVPSVTYFGMPALLPHTEMQYDKLTPTVLLDGSKATDVISRQALLQKYNVNSLALRAEEILDAKVADLKSKFAGQDVIYIYHNQIDAKADNSKTEAETFDATAIAINEIMDLIKRLRSSNITNIMVTADHGFIYRHSDLDSTDKIDLKSADFIKKSPRYAISTEQFEQLGVESVTIGDILNNADTELVYYPTTANIFNAPGSGKNYVHGGVSPLEMIVPLLQVHAMKGKDTSELVEITLRPGNTRITSTSIAIAIIQKDAISATIKGATFMAYFEDADGNVISSKEKIDAYLRDEKQENRIINARINIFDREYDRTKKYFLVVENIENAQKVIHEQYVMDMAIRGGFGFDLS